MERTITDEVKPLSVQPICYVTTKEEGWYTKIWASACHFRLVPVTNGDSGLGCIRKGLRQRELFQYKKSLCFKGEQAQVKWELFRSAAQMDSSSWLWSKKPAGLQSTHFHLEKLFIPNYIKKYSCCSFIFLAARNGKGNDFTDSAWYSSSLVASRDMKQGFSPPKCQWNHRVKQRAQCEPSQ